MSDTTDNNINNENGNIENPERHNLHSICPLCCIFIQEIRKCYEQTSKSLSMDNTNHCHINLNQNNTVHNLTGSIKVNKENSGRSSSSSSSSSQPPPPSSSSPPPPPPSSSSPLKHDNISVIILDELKRFCENTTIRGLPRIVRAHNRYLRSLWLILVCILILGCFICMFFLARQYLEYNVIHPPRVLRHTISPFPSVTICNFRPISPDGLKYLQMKGWKTPRHFVLDIATYAQYIFYDQQKIEEYNAASAAFSLAGFLESLPNNEERRKLGYQHNKLIIKCQITYLNGSKPVAAPCERKGIWRKFIHAQYLNCATFEPFSYLRSDITNIEMYIYLDEMLNRADCIDCFHGEVKSQLSGALISIHGADTLPNINDKSINLKPGTLTELRLSIIENIQQMPPYGRCSINHPLNITLYDMIYNYSEYACRVATIQNNINQQCGCYTMEYPYNENKGYKPCTDLSQFINQSNCNRNNFNLTNLCINNFKNFISRIMCKRSVIENYLHGELPNCKMPCSFYSYESEQSISTWPTKSWQLTWLNSSYNKKLGIFNNTEFIPYLKAQQLLELGNHIDAVNILDKIDVLERKLLAILINRPNFDVRKVEEKIVLSLTSLLSQTGGLFSIWIGLSMISLGELFELFIRCYIRLKHSNHNNNNNTNNSNSNDNNTNNNNKVIQHNNNSLKQNNYYPLSNYNDHILHNLLLLNQLHNNNNINNNNINDITNKINKILINEENNLHNLLLLKKNENDQSINQ
uniref:Amiloride-sensitive sodium channel,putative n=1 Tax=Schistosoma mansoni TaxID=6183 RepID=A0A3Q0KIM0_SCHMA